MEFNQVIGITASVLTGSSLVPQLIKIIREKKTENISTVMLGVLLTGLGFWVYYGILIEDRIIVVSNGFSALVNAMIIILTIRYNKK